jgi:hypothetical protein
MTLTSTGSAVRCVDSGGGVIQAPVVVGRLVMHVLDWDIPLSSARLELWEKVEVVSANDLGARGARRRSQARLDILRGLVLDLELMFESD